MSRGIRLPEGGRWRRRLARIASVCALGVLTALLCAPSPAHADQTNQGGPGGSSSGGGYTAQVAIRFSGDAAPGGGGTRLVRVAPSCWWSPAAGPYTDAVAMLAWYDAVTGGTQTRGMLRQYGPRKVWLDAANAEKNHTADTSWYKAYCKDPKDYANYNVGSVEGVDPINGNPTNWVTFLYRAFNAGAAIPPPLVSPEELARAARDAMVIPLPDTDRNPKIQSDGQPTLVGLPTWFWVLDPAAVGGAAGSRTIRAEVAGPAGNPIWAQVVARTSGLDLSWPGGAASCPPSRARTAYAVGVAQSQACTVQFTKASVGFPNGYRVSASTAWQATWTGSGGTGGVLPGLARQFQTNVPVAEVQNIVTR